MVHTSGTDADYEQFVQRIKVKTGIDLHAYKEQQMQRRLAALRQRRGYDTFATYISAVNNNPNLLEELLDQMTINFSEFFRNPQKWDVLKSKILPQIIKQSRKPKIWSAACSTGEEPYSLAMMLSDISGISFDIRATDIDERVLEQARRGVYAPSTVQQIPTSFCQRFLRRLPSGEFQIADEMRRGISFSKHNLLADPYPKELDLIICRNVLIYFTDDTKDEILKKFSKSLQTGGFLFVGGTEHVRNPKQFGLEATSDMYFYRKVGE